MPLNQAIIRALGITGWPVVLRHPAIKALLKRKKIDSFPFRVRFGDLVYDGDAANLIDYHVLTRGGFEPGLDRLLIDWSRFVGGQDKVFLDVGANSGLHSIQMSVHYREVHAFEPYPPMFERLQHSISINGLDNVVTHQVALNDAPGAFPFRLPAEGNTGTGFLLFQDGDLADEQTTTVRAETGDDFLQSYAAPVAAIKIDVEGAEPRVMAGLSGTIGRYRPILVFEVLRGGASIPALFADQLPQDYLMFRFESTKRSRYSVRPWGGEEGDIVAIAQENLGFFGEQ